MDGPLHAWKNAILEIDSAILSAKRRGHEALGRGDYGAAAILMERLRSLENLKALIKESSDAWAKVMVMGPEPRVLPLEGDWGELIDFPPEGLFENLQGDVSGKSPEDVSVEHAIERTGRRGEGKDEVARTDTSGSESSPDAPMSPGTGPAMPALTPQRAYREPILRILRTCGGSAPAEHVLEELEKEFRSRFTPRDLQKTASNRTEPRWRNSARWCRKAMVSGGLLKSDSPRGVWEVTEAGLMEPNAPAKQLETPVT